MTGIDLDREEPWALSEGPKRVGKSYWSLKAYIETGVKNFADPEGDPVRLEKCYLPGGELATTTEAYKRFMKRLNGIEP